MSRRILLFALSLVAAAGVAAALAFALMSGSDTGADAFLSVVGGDVSVREAGSGSFRPGVDGEELHEGDTVRTGVDGRAVVTLFDGSTQSLEPEGEITIERVDRTAGDGLSGVIRQAAGATWSSVYRGSQAPADFSVETPAVAATVRDTMFRVFVLDSGATEVWTRQGAVIVEGANVSQSVAAGSRAFGERGQPPLPPLPAPPSDTDLSVTFDSQGWLMLRSPDGFVSGLVPPGAPVNQVPLAVITDDTVRPQTLSLVSLRSGTYDFFFTAPKTTDYELDLGGTVRGWPICRRTLTGTIDAGKIWRARLEVEVRNGALARCALSEPEIVEENPYEGIVLPEVLLDRVREGQRLIPAASVAAQTVSPSATPSATSTPSATHTATPSPALGREAAYVPAEEPPIEPPPDTATPVPFEPPSPSPASGSAGEGEPAEVIPTAAPQPSPTATFAPSASPPTPEATATPVPSSTPTRTATPTPTPTATPTPTPTPSGPCAPPEADVNGDGVVTQEDENLVAAYFGQTSPPAPSSVDVNGDGVVTVSDIQRVLAYEGLAVCP
ncbi:MAG TPA: FecR domain-containing protein [Dehalococcoidia bacterium]|nr:FecR domain-containing protein [Dehalococcoidia bacterium]